MRSPQHDPRRVAAALLILLVICAGSLVRQAYAQSPKGKAELQ